jgi:hypothetical protein
MKGAMIDLFIDRLILRSPHAVLILTESSWNYGCFCGISCLYMRDNEGRSATFLRVKLYTNKGDETTESDGFAFRKFFRSFLNYFTLILG